MNDKRKRMYCPILKEMCIEGWTATMGEDPQTHERPKCRFWIGLAGEANGKPVDDYDCAIAWQPTLMVEQARVQNSSAAAIESMRNRMVEAKNALLGLAHRSPPVRKSIDAETVTQKIAHKPKKRKKKNK